ncbi:putative Chitin elicitor receptor kinase 1, RLK1 [Hibiscus syriacus]|uniref:Chitin elicitor receptor kinase 1, RLK1 n=1 Tax=Hibiscus syriacus TaxID=106335 RepID=A0A6A2XBX1_HIBSY|nr:putative Chitin elicitor receptor kinase 1, RLK1 [Hibiscus syriacus]
MFDFKRTPFFSFLCCFVVLFPSLALGGCTCRPEDEDRNKPLALKYKVVAIVCILVAGAMGVCFPLVGKSIDVFHPETKVFFVFKAFAAGVILSTGFIHVLPDAMENLTSPCLDEDPWRKFPFAGLVEMSVVVTLNADMFAISHLNKTLQGHGHEENTRENDGVHVLTHGMLEPLGLPETPRYQVVSQVLELGIMVHSDNWDIIG